MKKRIAKRKKQFLEPSDERIEMHAKWFARVYEAWKKRRASSEKTRKTGRDAG